MENVLSRSENAFTKILVDIESRGGVKGVDIANLTEVSKATVSRWTSGKASPSVDKQLLLSDLRYVVFRLSEFYEYDEVRTWLYSRNDLLKGRSAMELIHDGQTEKVLSAIEQIETLSYD